VNRRLSVLITGKQGRKETYNGILIDVNDNFLVLETLPSESFEIEKFFIRLDIIESVWLYKEKTNHD